MKKTSALLLLLLFVVTTLDAQNLFTKRFSHPSSQVHYTTHTATNDGGLACLVRGTDINYSPLELIKTDANGNIQWTHTLQWLNPLDNPVIVQGPDSCFFICTRRTTGPLQHTYSYLKLNPTGDSILYHYYVDVPLASSFVIDNDVPMCIPRNDGTYLVGATLNSGSFGGNFRWHIMNISGNGQILWSHVYNENLTKVPMNDIDTCSNGDIVLCGTWPAGSSWGTLVTRIDPAGGVLWSQYYFNNIAPLIATEICGTDNGNIALVSSGPSVTMLNGNGSVLWHTEFIPSVVCIPGQVQKAPNGALFIAGTADPYSGFGMKVDAAGVSPGIHIYDSLWVTSLHPHTANGFSISGYYYSYTHGHLVTTSATGNNCGEVTTPFTTATASIGSAPEGNDSIHSFNIIADTMAFIPFSMNVAMECFISAVQEHTLFEPTVWPSPATDHIFVRTTEVIEELSVIDLQGRCVYRENTGAMRTVIDVSALPAGLYMVVITSGDRVSTVKIPLVH